jgi:hypothetical protein
MRATNKEIQEQAEWVLSLATQIYQAAMNFKGKPEEDIYGEGRHSGTIKNLCPELSKSSSKLNQMNQYNFK